LQTSAIINARFCIDERSGKRVAAKGRFAVRNVRLEIFRGAPGFIFLRGFAFDFLICRNESISVGAWEGDSTRTANGLDRHLKLLLRESAAKAPVLPVYELF